jgi:hypothetical protein
MPDGGASGFRVKDQACSQEVRFVIGSEETAMQEFRAIIFGIIVAVLFGVIGYSGGYRIFDQGHLHHLASTGVRTQATVSAKDRDNHRSIRYVYEVSGKRFEGSGSPERVGRQFDQVNLQDQISVLYDPVNPSDSFLGDPEALAAGHEPLILIVSLAIGGIAFLASLPFVIRFTKMRT